MPTSESPNMNSSRVQRAYRINNIEHGRLSEKLRLLEKEKIHNIRLSNQDIRLISVTLDYINSSSGHSPEGLAPGATQTEIQREDDDQPCFMYGERIISRKRRRVQRPHSSITLSRRRDCDSRAAVANTINNRPQSSPAKGFNTFVTSVNGSEDDSSTVSDGDSLNSARSSDSTSWIDETTEITKKLLRANLNSERDPRRRGSMHQRDYGRRRSSLSANKFEMLNRKRQSISAIQNKDSNQPLVSKSAGIMDILNQKRPTLSAQEWKSHLTQTKDGSGPRSFSAQKQHTMDIKVNTNNNHRQSINNKIKGFVDKLDHKR